MIGKKLAHYEITAKIGEGGMGEVYRGRDDRLNRDVAVKLLPQSVEEDPARLARFKREAQLLASLTHGNIAQVYGLEEQDGHHAIVLELVEGEDLSQRLARGPIPLDEAREIAIQIAEALEAAHEKGIVHRDLKPANVKLAHDGTVKVLDFGLAKALTGDEEEGDVSNSPTLTAAATQAGIILGTAAYMAPEQAKGKPVDRRADVWAFGCVLYEMLSGRAPFDGEGVSEILAHVITQEPDFAALPDEVPAPLRDLLERCLRKDPRRRVPDVAVARIALQELDDVQAVATEREPARPRKGVLLPWWSLALFGLLIVPAVAWLALSGGSAVPPAATHFDLSLEPPHVPGPIAISPEGDRVYYSGSVDGTRRLLVRRLDGHTSEEIPGTEGGLEPFLSPDGKQLAFGANGQLKRVSLAGGLPVVLTSAPGQQTGGVWTDDGTIIYSSQILKLPHRIDAGGGEATPLPMNGVQPGDAFGYPRLLPDHDKLLLTRVTDEGPEVVLLDRASGDWSFVVRGSDGRLVPPDRLLFVQGDRLMQVSFDPGSGAIAGEPDPVALHVPGLEDLGLGSRFNAALAANGTLAFASGASSNEYDILRVSADGAAEPLGFTGYSPAADAAGRRIVVSDADQRLRLHDLETGTNALITFSPSATLPVWSPDETTLYFGDRRSSTYEAWTALLDGSRAAERLFESPVPSTLPTSVAADGTLMGYGVHPVTNRDIWLAPPGGKPTVILETPANERAPAIAPFGRLYAYVSNEEGTDEIYLRDLEAPERRWQLSNGGGISPVWGRDGRELFFLRGSSLIGVEVQTTGGVRIGKERIFFSHDRLLRDDWGNRTFDTLPEGGFLVSVQRESEVVLRVVLGFGG